MTTGSITTGIKDGKASIIVFFAKTSTMGILARFANASFHGDDRCKEQG